MRPIIPVLFVFVAAFALSSTACASPHKTTFPQHIMFNYTADDEGEMFPCGCRIPLGGLSRRGGVLSEELPYPKLTLDAGGFSGGTTGYDRLVGTWVLKAYVLMGYNVVNIGYDESLQPVSAIREWDEASQGMLVSANLTDDSGNPVTRPYLIREVGGIKVGITGVTGFIESEEPNIRARMPRNGTEMPKLNDPVESLKKVMDEFKTNNIDFVVLLADLNMKDLKTLLGEISGIDLAICGQEFHSKLRAGTETFENIPTRVIRIGGLGKYLGRLRLDFDSKGKITGEEGQRIELDSTVPTMSEISGLLVDFKTELRKRREEFLADPSNPFKQAGTTDLADVLTGYASAAFCKKCHLPYTADPGYTLHENAWLILDEAHKNDPECLACHTTGYGLPTGFLNPDRDGHLGGVQCEACHGPASEHVTEMTKITKNLDPSLLIPPDNPTGLNFSVKVPEAVCLKCHTKKWSPNFDYRTWVQRINHNKIKDKPTILNTQTDEAIDPTKIDEYEKSAGD